MRSLAFVAIAAVVALVYLMVGYPGPDHDEASPAQRTDNLSDLRVGVLESREEGAGTGRQPLESPGDPSPETVSVESDAEEATSDGRRLDLTLLSDVSRETILAQQETAAGAIQRMDAATGSKQKIIEAAFAMQACVAAKLELQGRSYYLGLPGASREDQEAHALEIQRAIGPADLEAEHVFSCGSTLYRVPFGEFPVFDQLQKGALARDPVDDSLLLHIPRVRQLAREVDAIPLETR